MENGIFWEAKHPQANIDMLGYIPQFVSLHDPRGAVEQFDDNYRSGGGWTSFKGFDMLDNGNMQYPGDPQTRLLYEARLRDETIRVYESAWVAVIQPDGSFDVARMD